MVVKSIAVFLLILCIIALTGCGVNAPTHLECVNDDLDAPVTPAFALSVQLPEDPLLSQRTDNGALTIYQDYEILEEVFPASSAQVGVEALTGRPDLFLVKMASFPREEYRFSWAAAGEAGDTACCGALIYDGSYCYSVCIQCPADRENEYREMFYSILSTTELDMV